MIHSLQPGGAEAQLVELAEVAAGVGLDVMVLSIMRTADSPYAARISATGADVIDLGRCSRWDPRALTLGLACLRAWQPDVIHSHLKHADLVGAVAARRLHVPLVSTLHLIEDRPGLLGGLKRRTAALARISTAARTVAVSEAQRDWYLRTFHVRPETVLTVHNGVPPGPVLTDAQRADLRASLGAEPSTLLAVNVGIMRPGKGQGDLLTALGLLPDDLPLHVALVGDGPLRPHLEAQATEAGLLPRRVTFTGFRHDVGPLLAAADLVVSASHVDALPMVLLQAVAAGRAVVATDVGGVPEIVDDRAAVLVPAGHPQALADALHALAVDPAERDRLGAAARARFEEEFRVTLWAERLRTLYDELLPERGRRRPGTR